MVGYLVQGFLLLLEPDASFAAPTAAPTRSWYSARLAPVLDGAGRGIACLPDLDPTFTPRDCFAESMVKRLTTPRGSLFWAPDYGIDIREALLARLDGPALRRLESVISRELEKDDRVDAASAAIALDAPLERLSARVEVTTSAGPYLFQIAVTALSVELLSAG